MTDEPPVIFFKDAFVAPRPPRTKRGALELELKRLKALRTADPGDADLRERIIATQEALDAFDKDRSAS